MHADYRGDSDADVHSVLEENEKLQQHIKTCEGYLQTVTDEYQQYKQQYNSEKYIK